MTQNCDLISRRSELLATVVLTRRLNIDVHPFGENGDQDIDLICTIRNNRVRGFLPFGVVVWGTSTELHTEEDATNFARTRKKVNKRTTFYMPVIVLLFSMHKDEAFFAWLVEPCEESNQLLNVTDLDFKTFDTKQLDRMSKKITNWYKRLAKTLVADAALVDPSLCANDE